MDEILYGMTQSTEDPASSMLDVTDGKVVVLMNRGPHHEGGRGFRQEIEEHPDRYPEIRRIETPEQYEWMCTFAKSVDEDDVREKLGLALAAKGTFGRFRQVVVGYPDLNETWQAMRQNQLCLDMRILRRCRPKHRIRGREQHPHPCLKELCDDHPVP
jgi:hypothetical protein